MRPRHPDVRSAVGRGRRRNGKWYITNLEWRPWWRLDIPLRAHYSVWKANRAERER